MPFSSTPNLPNLHSNNNDADGDDVGGFSMMGDPCTFTWPPSTPNRPASLAFPRMTVEVTIFVIVLYTFYCFFIVLLGARWERGSSVYWLVPIREGR